MYKSVASNMSVICECVLWLSADLRRRRLSSSLLGEKQPANTEDGRIKPELSWKHSSLSCDAVLDDAWNERVNSELLILCGDGVAVTRQRGAYTFNSFC